MHTIGFCLGSRHSLNQKGVVLYKSASDQSSLTAGLESVLAESEDFNVSNFSN
jgi:Ca-activated chloride channel homolog